MSEFYRSRSTNCILVKDDVGRAKRTCYELPRESHAYGKSEEADLEGAREVTMHWAAHVPRAKHVPDCQDFRKLNKLATKVKVCNARDLADLRRTTDMRLLPLASVGPLPKMIPSDVIPAFAYGRKSRPSTPIAAVVGCHFATEFEEAQDQQYERYRVEADEMNGGLKVRLTKASNARISGARSRRREMEDLDYNFKEPFKLSKFKKIQSRLFEPRCGHESFPTSADKIPFSPLRRPTSGDKISPNATCSTTDEGPMPRSYSLPSLSY